MGMDREPIRGQDVRLHHQSLELTGVPLHTKAEASERWGINGDVLAVIKLPRGKSQEPHINLAVIDSGPIEPGEDARPFLSPSGEPLGVEGQASERYGLYGLNHVPTGLGFAYIAVPEGKTTIGRNGEDRHNFLLGIHPKEKGVGRISRSQATITRETVGGAGDRITIADHSSNGTVVEIPRADQSESLRGAATPEKATEQLLSFVPDQHRPAAEKLLRSKKWQQLSPNFPDQSNLEPRDLTPEIMGAVLTALHSGPAESDGSRLVGSHGRLTPTDAGDAKSGFLFTTGDGRKLHVLMDTGYALPPTVQRDAKIYMRSSQNLPGKGYRADYGSYSDARTYVSLPLRTTKKGDMLGVHFQEYAGKPVKGALAGMRKATAATRAQHYIKSHGLETPNPGDFSKGDHYLATASGKVAVIDIDVVGKVYPLPR